jgi:hypothetical protein
METPARADRVTVDELLRWAREGRVRIPSFQRGLNWDADDKWKLLDSVERGYPVGTLLLWKRSAGTEPIGSPLRRGPALPASGDVYLVVDGQQRITTLWESLGLAPEPGRPAMLFDVMKGFVVRAAKKSELAPTPAFADAARPPSLPMHLALDAVTLGEWIPPSLPREIKQRYYEVGKRLREYLVPIYVIEGDDVEVLRRVFDRTNSAGKPLTRDAVFDALVGSRVTRNGESGLALVLEQLRDLSFGAVERSTILKAFEAIRGDRVGKLDPRSLDARAAEADLLLAAAALRKAIEFLQSIGVPHVSVLPYELPLVVLARVFHLYARPHDKSLVLLKRWFWRGAVRELHGGASSSLQQHVDDVRADDEHGSVQRLLHRTGKPQTPDLTEIARQPISIATARGKIVLCAMLAHVPRDLRSGEKITAEALFAGGADEATQSIVQPPSVTELGASISNRLLHPAVGVAPSRLLRDCIDEGALASHGIDRQARVELSRGNAKGFLERRATTLEGWIDDFVGERAEWGRPDTPPVKMLAHRKRAS